MGETEQAGGRREVFSTSFRAPWLLFWIALLVRVLVVVIGRTWRTPPEYDHFNFAFEMGRIAQSLVEGHGYASPFGGRTGPTTWIMPLYPLMLAGVFKVAGVYSALSAAIMHCIDSMFAAVTAMAVAEIGSRVFGRRLGLWAGWIWALYPGTIQYPIHWIWDMSLAAMCFALMLVQAMRMRGVGDGKPRLRAGDWGLFGVAWGFLGLANPTTLLLLPVTFLWVVWGPGGGLIGGWLISVTKNLGGMVLCAIVFWAVLSPWVVRNWMAFHAFIPTRGNLGSELESAWSDTWHGFPAQGQRVGILERDPSHQHYAQLGETAWVKEQGAMARVWLHRDPWRVLVREPLLRVEMFWASVPHAEDRHAAMEFLRELNYAVLSVTGLLGIALTIKRKVAGAAIFAWAALIMPLTYYFITTAARFRHPLEVVLILATVYLFSETEMRFGFSGRI